MPYTPTAVKCYHCGKTLGIHLNGIYVTTCPGCKNVVVLDTTIDKK